MSSYRVGLMLYSVRDACAGDLEGTLREVAALGYDGVEIFDLHGHAPETVADWLDELGLVAIARHSSLEGIESRLPELAAEARALGWERLVVSWVDPANLNDETIDRLALAATAVSSAGLELGYHNHDAEVEQGFLDRLPHGVFLELDAGWAWYAGADPLMLLATAGSRTPLVHVKDMRRDGGPVHVPLGRGDVDYRGLADAANRAGVEWLIVEQDETDDDAFEAVAESLARLRSLVEVPA